MKKLTISEETLNVIVGYLQTKPYNEVAGILQRIQNDLVEASKPVTREPVAKEAKPLNGKKIQVKSPVNLDPREELRG